MGANDDRFLELAGLFLEGAAGAVELEALDRIVKGDAEARRTLAHLVDQDATLRRLHAKPTAAASAASSRPVPVRPAPRRRTRVLAGAAAAGLLGAVVAWLLLGRGGGPEPGPVEPPPAVAKRGSEAPPSREPASVPPREGRSEPAAVPIGPPETAPVAAPPAQEAPPAVVQAAPHDGAPAAEPVPDAPVDPPAVEEAPDAFTTHPAYPPKEAAPERVPPAPGPAAPTVAGISLARLERVEGEVFLLAGGGAVRVPVAAGKDLVRGSGLATGAGSRAVATYPDGTRLDAGPETMIALISRWTPRGAAPGTEGGKYLQLRAGTLVADVAAQPKGLPMILGTPLADVQVLGTRFTLAVGPEMTRVQVDAGRVVVVRRADRAAAEVRAGQVLEVGAGGPLAAKAAPPAAKEVARVRFGPAGTAVPDGTRLDSGEAFDAKRGYGWLGAAERRRSLVGIYHDRQWVTKGREPRAFAKAADPARASGVSAGSAFHAETWEMALPSGRYLVTVCAGDAGAAQGPHHVVVEGRPAIVAAPTAAGAFAEASDVPVAVADGRLTVAVGGHRSAVAPNPGRPGETTLVSVVVRKVMEGP